MCRRFGKARLSCFHRTSTLRETGPSSAVVTRRGPTVKWKRITNERAMISIACSSTTSPVITKPIAVTWSACTNPIFRTLRVRKKPSGNSANKFQWMPRRRPSEEQFNTRAEMFLFLQEKPSTRRKKDIEDTRKKCIVIKWIPILDGQHTREKKRSEYWIQRIPKRASHQTDIWQIWAELKHNGTTPSLDSIIDCIEKRNLLVLEKEEIRWRESQINRLLRRC